MTIELMGAASAVLLIVMSLLASAPDGALATTRRGSYGRR